MPVYAASTPVAMFAKPPTMIAMSSEFVAVARNGRTISGRFGLADKNVGGRAQRLAAPLVPIVLRMIHAKPLTTHVSTPM